MAVMYKIVEGEQPRLPDHFNPHLRKLFLRYCTFKCCLCEPTLLRDVSSRMLKKDPSLRPSAVEILQEPFIQERLEVILVVLSTSYGV